MANLLVASSISAMKPPEFEVCSPSDQATKARQGQPELGMVTTCEAMVVCVADGTETSPASSLRT
jgi:hypothetical protein